VLHAVRREDFGIIAPLFDGFDGGHMADAISRGTSAPCLPTIHDARPVAVLELRNELFAIFYVAGAPQHRAARAFRRVDPRELRGVLRVGGLGGPPQERPREPARRSGRASSSRARTSTSRACRRSPRPS